MKRWVLALGILVVLAPGAAASPASGEFAARSLSFPAGGSVEGDPLAALLTGGVAHGSLTLHAPLLRVTEHVRSHVTLGGNQVGTVPADPRHHNFTNVVVTHSGSASDPVVGLYPDAGAALRLLSRSDTIVEARASTPLCEGTEVRPDADAWWYCEQVREPHLLVTGGGVVQAVGPWTLKLRGMTIVVDSDDGRRVFETGVRQVSPAETEIRWLVVQGDAIDLGLDAADARFVAALGTGVAAWDGMATFEGATGSIRSEDAEYSATATTSVLGGELQAVLTPEAIARSMRLRMEVTGDLETTTLASAPLAQESSEVASTTGWLVVAGATVLAGGGLVAWARPRLRERARPREGDALAYFLHYAGLAQHRGDPRVALEWLDAASRIAPRETEVHVARSLMLRALGEHADAREAMEEAARHARPDDGLPDYYLAALLMEQAERSPQDMAVADQAYVHLERCLARDPDLAAVVERDPIFVPLHGHDLSAMLDDAHARPGPLTS